MYDCIFCHCSVLKKYGTRHSKSDNIQRFLSGNCKRASSINIGFERMNHNPQAVTTALKLIPAKGSCAMPKDQSNY